MLNKDWLKTARILLGMSQKEIADQMCTTKQTICNIETGKSSHKMTMAFYELTLKSNIENHLNKERIKKVLLCLEEC